MEQRPLHFFPTTESVRSREVIQPRFSGEGDSYMSLFYVRANEVCVSIQSESVFEAAVSGIASSRHERVVMVAFLLKVTNENEIIRDAFPRWKRSVCQGNSPSG